LGELAEEKSLAESICEGNGVTSGETLRQIEKTSSSVAKCKIKKKTHGDETWRREERLPWFAEGKKKKKGERGETGQGRSPRGKSRYFRHGHEKKRKEVSQRELHREDYRKLGKKNARKGGVQSQDCMVRSPRNKVSAQP